MSTEPSRSVPRLVATSWTLIPLGIIALGLAFVLNFYPASDDITRALIPVGWIALLFGIACAGMAAYHRSLDRRA